MVTLGFETTFFQKWCTLNATNEKSSRCVHYATRESGGTAPLILNLGTRWGESSSRSGRLTPEEENPCAH